MTPDSIGQVAYRGKAGCKDPRCTRDYANDECMGWHCPYCHEPCSMMGHRCDPSHALKLAFRWIAKLPDDRDPATATCAYVPAEVYETIRKAIERAA